MRPTTYVLGIWLTMLSGCGGDDIATFPVREGEISEYFPLQDGSTYVYRRDGDPTLTAKLVATAPAAGLLDLQLESDSGDFPTSTIRVRIEGDDVQVLRLQQGGIQLVLDSPLEILSFPLRDQRAFTSSTSFETLGAQFTASLFGVVADLGDYPGIDRVYARAFQVVDRTQLSLLGDSQIEFVLAPGVGPVEIRQVSPALELLGFEGVELRLQLLTFQP